MYENGRVTRLCTPGQCEFFLPNIFPSLTLRCKVTIAKATPLPGLAVQPRPLNSHEEHQLDDGGRPEQLREGVDEEVIAQQQELQGEHQAVVAGLEHLPSALLVPHGHIPQLPRTQLPTLSPALEEKRLVPQNHSCFLKQEPAEKKKN